MHAAARTSVVVSMDLLRPRQPSCSCWAVSSYVLDHARSCSGSFASVSTKNLSSCGEARDRQTDRWGRPKGE